MSKSSFVGEDISKGAEKGKEPQIISNSGDLNAKILSKISCSSNTQPVRQRSSSQKQSTINLRGINNLPSNSIPLHKQLSLNPVSGTGKGVSSTKPLQLFKSGKDKPKEHSNGQTNLNSKK